MLLVEREGTDLAHIQEEGIIMGQELGNAS